MLTSEFNADLGSLIRRLEAQIRQDPQLALQAQRSTDRIKDNVLDDIERAIVDLIALYLRITRGDA